MASARQASGNGGAAAGGANIEDLLAAMGGAAPTTARPGDSAGRCRPTDPTLTPGCTRLTPRVDLTDRLWFQRLNLNYDEAPWHFAFSCKLRPYHSEECCVCMDAPRSSVLLPCGRANHISPSRHVSVSQPITSFHPATTAPCCCRAARGCSPHPLRGVFENKHSNG